MGKVADVALSALRTMDAQDYDALRKLMAEDVEFTQGGAVMKGIDEVIAMLKSFYGALPDLEHRVLNVVEDESTAAVEMNVVATHKGHFESDLGSFPPSGKQTSWYSSTFVDVEGDEVVRQRTYLDVLAVHMELGYQPAKQTAEAA